MKSITSTIMRAFLVSAATLAFQTVSYAAQPTASGSLTVKNEANQPVAGASILIGQEPNAPFQGNVLTTDAQGQAALPDGWTTALPVTVISAGYITSTTPNVQPTTQTLQLTHQESGQSLEVKGTTENFGRLVTDGKVDFGMIIPSLSRDQMLSFDISTIISPRNDTISIIGNEVKIPTNISLPDQSETYIFPIRLNKPDYRLYLREPGAYQLGVTHGQFPLQRVVSDIRAGKSFLEVVNYFDFKEMGVKDVIVNGDMSGVNLPVNQTPFDKTFTVKAPAFASGLVMMSLGLIEQNDHFLPSDVKRLTPNQSMNLKTNKTVGHPYALSLLMEDKNGSFTTLTQTLKTFFEPLMPLPTGPFVKAGVQNFSKLSFALQPADNGATPTFLPLIEKPSLNGQTMTLDVPQLPADLQPLAMYVILSEIETTSDGSVKVERRTRLWEITSPTWLAQIELPKIDIERRADRQYRWEVLFLAHPSSSLELDLKSVTHVTRNTLDL